MIERLRTALRDRYRLERELGRGGSATVYLAHDLKHERRVALKVLHPELTAILGAERFLGEIRTTANLQHPHILPLFDSGEAEGLLYYVMPYVEGETLRGRLAQERQLPVGEALEITAKVAAALDYAHRHGVVHRDIKPENILLHEGQPMVSDFGIALAVGRAGGSRLTETGFVVGTSYYMSPEQAFGDDAIDARSDIYSLGCVLYEMLAGDPPFTASTPQAILARKLEDHPPSLRTVRRSVGEPVERALAQALESRPADRFQTISEFVQALEGASTESQSRWHKGRWARTGALVGVGAAAVLVLVSEWKTEPVAPPADHPSERLLVAQFDNETGDPGFDDLGKIAADWLARDLQQIAAIEVVDPRAAVFSPPPDPSEYQEVAGVQRLARRLEAGTAVTGSYYLRGDSLHFQVRLTEAETGILLRSLDPVAGLREDPLEGLARLGSQVTAAAAALFDPDFAPLAGKLTDPRSYEAYRAYVAGLERFGRREYQAAAASATGALAMDSTFHPAAFLLAGATFNLGRREAFDSLLQWLDARRDRLTPLEQHILGAWGGDVGGDRTAAYRAGLQAYELAPTVPEVVVTAARAALYANRPRTAAEMLLEADLSQGPLEGWVPIWGVLRSALHVLGEHERELQVARDGRARYPDRHYFYFAEGQALAAQGRLDEMESALQGLLALPPAPGYPEAWVRTVLGRELNAHGHPAAASEMLERAVAWGESLPAESLSRVLRGQMLYDAERWNEVRPVFDSLLAERPQSLGTLGALGVVAARLGDVREAERKDRALAAIQRDYLLGENTRWRARIAAALGDRERAVALLREAFREGLAYSINLHRYPAFQSLRDYPPYQELLRPKG